MSRARDRSPSREAWSEEEYLSLSSNLRVELADGLVEVLGAATTSHQTMVLYLYRGLRAFVAARGLGLTLTGPLPVRLRPGTFREPDVVFMLAEHADRIGEAFWDRADLVMEVVSDDDRRRDLETKRREYAEAGIPEYWIVDPQLGRITVLRLEGNQYAVHGEFARGDRASSHLLGGFEVDVTAALAARP
jgi:Uma2 family endonuclease